MIRHILVPTDFSVNADKAAFYAASLARKSKCSITLLHVNDLIVDAAGEPFPLQEGYTIERTMQMEKQLSQLQWRFSDVDFTSRIVKGAIVDQILSVAEGEHIDLIIMGTRGASPLKGKLIGTQTASVISRTTIPVLSIPADYQREDPDGILFATNWLERDLKLIRPVAELAELFHAKVHVVVFHSKEFGAGNEDSQQLEAYIRYLAECYPALTFTGEILEGVDFTTALELYHASHRTDMAALITYPKDFWQRLFQKSVTRKVVFNATLPVLAIPA